MPSDNFLFQLQENKHSGAQGANNPDEITVYQIRKAEIVFPKKQLVENCSGLQDSENKRGLETT